MKRRPVAVIAHCITGTRENLTFDSYSQAAEYFNSLGGAGCNLSVEKVRRLCRGDGLWSYRSVAEGRTVQVVFDELYTGEDDDEADIFNTGSIRDLPTARQERPEKRNFTKS